MREIKFRGKSLDNNEWVFGYYAHHEDVLRHREIHGIYSDYADSMPDNDSYSFYPDFIAVNPETVGQFTGLHDKNGKEIYEGDIVSVRTSDDRFTKNPTYKLGVVKYDDEYYGRWKVSCYYRFIHEKMKVIGNIHDSPELLKGGEK